MRSWAIPRRGSTDTMPLLDVCNATLGWPLTTFRCCPLVLYHCSVSESLSCQPTWVETFQDHSHLTTLHGIHLVHRKTHMLVPLNWSVAHFHFYRGSVALLYYCRQHPPGLRAPSSHMPRGAGFEVLPETNIRPGNSIPASLIAESPKVWGVVLGSCSKLIEREGKGTTLFSCELSLKKCLLQCKFLQIDDGVTSGLVGLCSKSWGPVKRTHHLLSLHWDFSWTFETMKRLPFIFLFKRI